LVFWYLEEERKNSFVTTPCGRISSESFIKIFFSRFLDIVVRGGKNDMARRKTLSGIGLVLVMLSSLMMVSIVSAESCESFLNVDVTFFGNYTSPTAFHDADMSDFIYVGNSSSPFGQTTVNIPLGLNGIQHSDVVSGYRYSLVPGLHILRDSDDEGTFVYISAAGFNDNLSREAIKADFEFENAEILSTYNGLSPSGKRPFERQGDGECGIDEGNISDIGPGRDEYSFDIGGTDGNICSTTSSGEDRVKVYYEDLCPILPECSDEWDNDGDGLIDADDLGCWEDPSDPGSYNSLYNNESNDPEPNDDVDGDGYNASIDDCNDNNASINPGAREVCDDDVDNDCDGRVDEGCGSNGGGGSSHNYCGDLICDAFRGETVYNCAIDCGSVNIVTTMVTSGNVTALTLLGNDDDSSFMNWWIVLLIVFIVLLIIAIVILLL
jgi:hypothetical protein